MMVREEDKPVNNARLIHTIPRSNSSELGQPTFVREASDKNQVLSNMK